MENVDNKEQTTSISDLLIHAIEKRPNEFQDAFNDMLTQRIASRIDTAKQEIAANYFNYTDEDGEESEQETDSGEPVEQEEQETTDEVDQNGQDAETV